jgi:putative MATE family efflux protein
VRGNIKEHSINSSNKPSNPSMGHTKGVKTLLGDPKKAILKLSIPMIIAMSVHTLYNLFDAIWVSGLGADALAAVGFFFPFFFMAMAIATGIGIGGGAAISRRIGANDKIGADNVAVHTLVLMVIIAIIFTVPFLILSRPIFILIGAEEIIEWVVAYSNILFAGSIVIFFTLIANSILRAEGDANRAMWAMVVGAGLNIVLDPIFIFGPNNPGPWIFKNNGFDLGVAGAAWATLISMIVTAIIMIYWLFIKKDTFISYSFKNFKWDRPILKDISRVGLPAAIMQLSMAFTMLLTNLIVVYVGGTDGIAVYSAGWRVVMISILPLLGIATAVVSVTGAAFGAKEINKLKVALMYAIKIGLMIEIVVGLITFILAPQIAAIFTQSKDSARIKDDLIVFLQVMWMFYPGVAFGMFSSGMFQGTGRGTVSLITTIIRTIILTTLFGLLMGIYLNMGLVGIWIGIVIANLTGSSIAFLWANIYIKDLEIKFNKGTSDQKIMSHP